MSTYRLFKNAERQIAKLLGGERTGHFGGEDVKSEWLSVEVKSRKKLPQWLVSAMEQSEGHAANGKLPIVVLHQNGELYTDALVICRLGDFVDWFGD